MRYVKTMTTFPCQWAGNAEEEDSASDSELWKGPLPETDEKSQ